MSTIKKIVLVPINDTQTINQKWSNLAFVTKSFAMYRNLWKNNFSMFAILSFWNMIDCVIKILRKFIKKNQKWSYFFHSIRCAMLWNMCKINFQIFVIFSFWDMVDFLLKILSELGTLKTALRLFANLIQKR